jgi:hypothetical protein
MDTRGDLYEIANVFFREKMTHRVSKLKFVLLISYAETRGRALQFRDTVRLFAAFLGAFANSSLHQAIANSTGLVVTKIVDKDEEILSTLKTNLKEILEENYNETSGVRFVFNQVIDRLQVFSNPNKPVLLSDEERVQIGQMIDSLDYLEKKRAQIVRSISGQTASQLMSSIDSCYDHFKIDLETRFVTSLAAHFNKSKFFLPLEQI